MLTSYFRLIYNRASHESLFLSLCDVSSPSHEFLITVPGFLRSSHLYQGKILFYFAHFCPFYVTHIWCSVLKSCLSLEIPRTPGFLVVTISWCAVYLVAAVCSNSCSLSRWCYLTISSFCPLSFCLPSFPASGSFPVSWLFTLGGQNCGVSASLSVLPMNIQGWFPLSLIGLISLQSKGLSRVFFSTTVWKHQFFST